MFWYFVGTFVAGFASGWAFFKHRAKIKAEVEKDATQLRNSAANMIKK